MQVEAHRDVRERDIAQALKEYDEVVRPAGDTLPESQSKLHHFREVLEQHAFKLADRRGMYDLIPFVFAEETKQIKDDIYGRKISIIFDGTTRLGQSISDRC